MDLSFSKVELEFRKEIRSWLRENVPDEPLESFDTEPGFQQHRDWEKTLYAGNWGMVTWPKEYGGQGKSAIEQFIFYDETMLVGSPAPMLTINTVGPTIMEYGTDEQKDYFLPKIAAGKLHFCIGYSEPDAGTDLASLTTKAVRDGDEYVINGQKT